MLGELNPPFFEKCYESFLRLGPVFINNVNYETYKDVRTRCIGAFLDTLSRFLSRASSLVAFFIATSSKA